MGVAAAPATLGWMESILSDSLCFRVYRGMLSSSASSSALVLLAKWPGSGASKTRLVAQLAAAGSATEDEARRWTAAFSRATVSDLTARIGGAANAHQWQCVLLYAPPVDEARQYFTALLEEAGVAAHWRLLPVLPKSNARSADLGSILTDAAMRAREACGTDRVAFFGADCPELSLRALADATRAAAEARVAAICPARDGGYTLLALPAEANVSECFANVHWSADDTCLSQLAALSRAGLYSVVHQTFSDVDELIDLQCLEHRLQVAAEMAGGAVDACACPRTAALLAEMRVAGALRVHPVTPAV